MAVIKKKIKKNYRQIATWKMDKRTKFPNVHNHSNAILNWVKMKLQKNAYQKNYVYSYSILFSPPIVVC